ncbi:sugar phosphate isomerase/epimerase family protein [Saccharicrinis fermentans]|uniref:sugar phosphate isomerase/epimerase family protein n=1 Tax=Saccharicrinis fermentans TaxID=982 RepID=UPI0004AD03F9|nr:sugar phosphate isomerase/epimerase family protein [Saccharicrinis fermentans]
MLSTSKTEAKQWELACQAWTFHRFTLSETLIQMEKLGIRHIELYPEQKVAPDQQGTTHFSMSDDEIIRLKALLKKHHIKISSYGVVTPTHENEWEQLFEFAEKMNIKTIVSEPQQALLPFIDSLCQQYKIRVAIHNHPEPTPYWNPHIVLKALVHRSQYIGVCADIGHWTRSGLEASECLKKLEGHIFEIHTKDVNRTDKQGHAVVFGEGIMDWPKVFSELERQQFKGKFVIEHEYNWDNPVPDLHKNILFFKLNTQ